MKRSKEKDNTKSKGGVKSETGEPIDKDGSKDTLFDVSNKLFGSLSASAYVVKMTKDGKVWSFIYRLWLNKWSVKKACCAAPTSWRSTHDAVTFTDFAYTDTWQTKNPNIPTCFYEHVVQNTDVATRT